MCRFALYLGPEIFISSLVTEPKHSLISQSVHSRESREPTNGDGFGIAWRAVDASGPMPAFRSIRPAWSNRNLRDLARATHSGCIMAHIRAATPGLPVTELNCHPFVHDRHALMHNGAIMEFAKVRRALLAELSDAAYGMIQGSTDSECFFGLFLDAENAAEAEAPLARMKQGLVGAIARVEAARRRFGISESAWLNVAVTDGERAVVSRFVSDPQRDAAATLYVSAGRRYACEDGVCRMLPSLGEDHAVLVASEPLSDDPGWEPVPVNHFVAINEHYELSYTPIELPGEAG